MKRIKKDLLGVLTPQEKEQLRGMLESSVFQKALGIVANFKPSPNCQSAGSGTRDAFSNERANARLGEIRGWEMHEIALFAAVSTPKELAKQIEESFPDSGLLGHDDRPPPKESQPPKK